MSTRQYNGGLIDLTSLTTAVQVACYFKLPPTIALACQLKSRCWRPNANPYYATASLDLVQKRRGGATEAISEDDLIHAIKQLKVP